MTMRIFKLIKSSILFLFPPQLFPGNPFLEIYFVEITRKEQRNQKKLREKCDTKSNFFGIAIQFYPSFYS